MSEAGQKVGVHLGRGGERGGGVWDNGDLHSVEAEYGRTVCWDTINSGPMRGGGEKEGVTGRDAVAGTGGS